MMQLHYDKEGEPRPAVSHEIGDDILLRVLPIAVEIREV